MTCHRPHVQPPSNRPDTALTTTTDQLTGFVHSPASCPQDSSQPHGNPQNRLDWILGGAPKEGFPDKTGQPDYAGSNRLRPRFDGQFVDAGPEMTTWSLLDSITRITSAPGSGRIGRANVASASPPEDGV